jgi:hypothetical protein
VGEYREVELSFAQLREDLGLFVHDHREANVPFAGGDRERRHEEGRGGA